jgi:hypothetical protein
MTKVVCAILLLGPSVIASAQSPDFTGPSLIASAQPPDAQQTPAQPHPQQQTNAPPPTPPPASPQSTAQTAAQQTRPFYRWELSGGWSHITGNEGLNGFNAGASVFLAPKISIGFNYDGAWDTTVLGAFALTNVGLTVTKSHLQDFMAGPRIYFPGVFALHCGAKGHLPILHPFVQAQFGESELWTEVSVQNVGVITSSDTAFSWLLGAGGDFDFDKHFAARISGDLLRTHFVDTGQSRLRLIVGLVGRF